MHFRQEEGSLSFLPTSINRRKGCKDDETPSDERFVLSRAPMQGCSLDKESQLIRSKGRVLTAVKFTLVDIWGRITPYRGAIPCTAGWFAASLASPH